MWDLADLCGLVIGRVRSLAASIPPLESSGHLGVRTYYLGYFALRTLIIIWGWNRRWQGSTWRTYDLDGFSYWHIHPVINRKPEQETGWDD